MEEKNNEKKSRSFPAILALMLMALIGSAAVVASLSIKNTDGYITITNGSNQNYTINYNTTNSVSGARFVGTTGTPTFVGGNGAGVAPTIAISGDDAAFNVSVVTGNIPSLSSTVFTVVFNQSWPSGKVPVCLFTPTNSNAALLNGVTMVYINQATATLNAVNLTAGTTALTATTAYTWNFWCST